MTTISRRAVAELRTEPEIQEAERMIESLGADPLGLARPQPWAPEEYIREEVARQGHDVNVWQDGGLRVRWMGVAWSWAKREVYYDGKKSPTFDDIVYLGRLVEPFKNINGLRRVGVRVGSRICPPPQEVEGLLRRLCETGGGLGPLDFYRELLLIHPFVDGNGRTGKVVLNWRAGTLGSPFFPPPDFWGEEIRNP